MSLPDLAAVLWRQRDLLERLVYRLECEHLLLAAGRTRFLALATAEVEELLGELRVLELQRASAADRVAAEVGMSGFSSLNTAVTGLAAAQRAMDVAGQNIVNANTPGYSRQRVQLAEVATASSSSLFTGGGTGVGGVTVAGVARIRDVFVEGARAAAGARQASLTSQTAALTGAQQLLAEPGTTGMQATMDSFYSAWHDLANNPTDVAAGSVVLQRGIAVTDQLHTLANGIAGQWSTARASLADTVTQANQAARDLADVNSKIAAGIVAGRPVNELMDRRDLLARSLGTLIGAVATQGEDGQVSVSGNRVAIVAGATAQQFTLAGAA